MKFLKLFFTLFGLLCLIYLLQSYGWQTLQRDFTNVGWKLLPLSLTFIPTLLCYSYAWYLITDIPQKNRNWQSQRDFFRLTIISIAWNNLSPFVKILGEPVKAILLERIIDRKAAIKSVVIYNIVHLIGTIGAFLLAALFLPFFFTITNEVQMLCFSLVAVCILLVVVLLTLPKFSHGFLKRSSFHKLRSISLILRWSMHKISFFYKSQKLKLSISLTLEVAARFLEGLTFYYAFLILGSPISAVGAAFLDVGRALVDNIFFFIPYQVGSREFGVQFLLEKILQISAQGAVSAALLYRLIEILWMILGYILWTSAGKSAKSLK